ncbi:MAG: hypothetical protein ACRD0G_12425 [Acidimicrobiales bacterium]
MAVTDAPSPAAPAAARPFWRRVQWLVLGLNVLFWGAILAYTAFGNPPDAPDHLDDPAFAAAAEPVCAGARGVIADLRLDLVADSPEERADQVDAENTVLRTMVADLREVDRPPGEEGEWVVQWLDDWDTHVADRQQWADNFRAGEDEPFVETARRGEQVSSSVDHFAEVNEMESCETLANV